MFENKNPFEETETNTEKTHFINQSENLVMALHYAEVMKWPVFPIHYPTENGCSCHKECKSIGKHPMIIDWPNAATKDKTQIINWWTQNPDANIGIPTGANTFYVLDIDVSDGKRGFESLEKLELQHGKLPETLSATTGSGGKHYCFANPGNNLLKNKTNIMPGIDFRGDGGYIVVDPSRHVSGENYKWDNLVGVELYEYPDEMPEWTVELVSKEKATVLKSSVSQPNIQNISASPIINGARNDTLFRLGCSMRENGNDESLILAALNGINQGLEEPLDNSEIQDLATNICDKYSAGNKEKSNQVIEYDLEVYLNNKYQIESNRDPNAMLGHKLKKFKQIESKLNGIQSGLYVIAAETNIGKTAFLSNLFMDLVESNNDLHGVYFSMDDHKKDIINKWVAEMTNISITQMQKRQGNQTDQNKILAAYQKIINMYKEGRLEIYDQSNLSNFNQLKGIAERLVGKQFFFAIDGIFNISVGNFNQKREENIERANMLKMIADQYEIPVIGTAEVRKSVQKQETRKLSLDDIMESAKFAYNANLVWLLSETSNENDQVSLYLKYAKNKLTGFKKSQNLIYLPDYGKITEEQQLSIMRFK
jgi:hypothetical protein